MSKIKEKRIKTKNPLYRFFISKRTAIVLIVILGVFTFLGTVIPQEDVFSDEEIIAHDQNRPISRTLNNILSVFEIADSAPWKSSIYAVYHSWWFVLSVLLLTLSLILCSYDRGKALAGIYKKSRKSFSENELKSKEMSAEFQIKTDSDEFVESFRQWAKNKFRIREEIHNGKTPRFRFQKQRFSRFGFLLVHIGLLFVIVGGMISAFTREKGFTWLSEGEEKSSYFSRTEEKEVPFGYTVRAEDLERVMYENGKNVKDWYTTLILKKGGKILAQKRIEVNDPLVYQGRRFYQTSWDEGYIITMTITEKATGLSRDYKIDIGRNLENAEGRRKTYRSGDGKLYFRVDKFYPDFRIENGRYITGSKILRNPALSVRVYWEELEEPKSKILFSRFPDLDFSMMSGESDETQDDPFKIILNDNIQKFYITGIEVGYDAGTDVVYMGFLIIVMGIIAGFYFYHRTVWALLQKKRTGVSLIVAGSASKNKYQFSRYMEHIIRDMRKYITEKTDSSIKSVILRGLRGKENE